jgi:hypothetical protein
MKPFGGRHRLVERVLAVPEYAAAYKEHCRKLMKAMTERFAEEVPQVERAIAEAKRREAVAVAARKEGAGGAGPGGRPGFGGPPGPGGPGGMSRTDLRQFLADRAKSVEDQLASRSSGVSPAGGFGGPGGPGGPPGFGGPGRELAGPILRVADSNGDGKLSRMEWAAAAGRLYQEADPERTGTLTEASLSAVLKRLLPAAPFGGPEAELARVLVRRAGAISTGAGVSRTAWGQAADALFDDLDRNRDGSLDEREVADGFFRLLPPPGGGFPPPPGGFPGPGGRP